MCLNIGTPKNINIPFVPNGKLLVLCAPILTCKPIRVYKIFSCCTLERNDREKESATNHYSFVVSPVTKRVGDVSILTGSSGNIVRHRVKFLCVS